MSRTKLLPVFLVLSILLAAQTLLADHAYTRGYDLGSKMGESDARAGRVADFQRSVTYRRATDGWNNEGDIEQYRTNFRFGFREGYQDGYRQAGGRISTGAVTTPGAVTMPGSTVARPTVQDAFTNGYDRGYVHGQRDAGRTNNATHSAEYRDANIGYDSARHGGLQNYRRDFRVGYQTGYDDGYNRRTADPHGSWQRSQSGVVVPMGQGTATPAGARDEAFVNGYREGYSQGQRDVHGAYRPRESAIYQEAMHGYNARRARSLEDYKFSFRQGFEVGYDDGYNGRASDFRRDAPRGFGTRRSGEAAAGTGSIFVPSGTVLRLRLNNSIGTRSSKIGDRFTANIQDPVMASGTNETAVPSGSTVSGTVTHVERPGRVGGTAELQLRYETLTLPNGAQYNLQASTTGVDQNTRVDPNEGSVEGRRSTTRDVGTVAAGAAIGAIIGAIAGGGKGAGIGAGVGSAIGVGAILTSRGKDIDLPAGTMMEIRLENGLELRR